jgi:hypothetical protein
MSPALQFVYRIIFQIWREKRAKLFVEKIRPRADERILDVGGVPDSWTARPQAVRQIECVNIFPQQFDAARFPQHRIVTSVGDGCRLQHEEGQFDIVYSNSVIEHVGDFAQQQKFAREVRRVGDRLWVQTPAYGCPVEPHFLLPFVHWLPLGPRRFVIRWFSPWAWMEKPSREKVIESVAFTQLLTKKQMRELFPDCEILTERLAGIFPKSYIAIRGASSERASVDDSVAA